MPVMLFQKNSIYILQANKIDYIHFVCDIPELEIPIFHDFLDRGFLLIRNLHYITMVS